MIHSIRKAIALERQTQQFLVDLKEEIGAAVDAAGPLSGVQMLRTHPDCAVISLSTLQQNTLSASTYLPAAQAAVVRQKLEPERTVQGLLDALKDMTKRQSACFPGKNSVQLNSRTLWVLQNFLCSADDGNTGMEE